MIGFLIDVTLLAAAITYAVKYYKFKKMAEAEFINYESRLETEESKRKEEGYVHESEMHLYKEEHGELTPEIEGARIEQEKLKQKSNRNNSEDLNIILSKLEKMQDNNVNVVKKVASSLYKKINNDLKEYLGK